MLHQMRRVERVTARGDCSTEREGCLLMLEETMPHDLFLKIEGILQKKKKDGTVALRSDPCLRVVLQM